MQDKKTAESVGHPPHNSPECKHPAGSSTVREDIRRQAVENVRAQVLKTKLPYKNEQKLEPYEYTPLPSSRSIRLLNIVCDGKGRVRCNLRTVNLDDKPCFNALSYTWDDPLWRGSDGPAAEYSGRTHEIQCDGRSIKVQKNLHDALLLIRQKAFGVVMTFKDKRPLNVKTMLSWLRQVGSGLNQSRYWEVNYVWIDAICINQQDSAERASQVALMGDLYRTAQNVIVFLGPCIPIETEAAIEVCSTLASIPPAKWRGVKAVIDQYSCSELGIPYLSREKLKTFTRFAQSRWFSRAWTLQEVALASNLIVLCGHREISWTEIAAAFEFLATSGWEVTITELAFDIAGIPKHNVYFQRADITSICSKVPMISSFRHKKCKRTLWDLLTAMRDRKAGDPRDVIYAAMGICDIPISNIIPDYTKPVSQVFIEATWTLIHQTQNLQLLHIVGNQSHRKTANLPSWVPDWTDDRLPGGFHNSHIAVGDGEKESSWYPAGDHRWTYPQGTFGSSELPISALRIDTIAAATPFPPKLTDKSSLKAILDIAIDHALVNAKKQHSIESMSETLWRTLIADTHNHSHGPTPVAAAHYHAPTSSSDARMFHDWVIWQLYELSKPASPSSSSCLSTHISPSSSSSAYPPLYPQTLQSLETLCSIFPTAAHLPSGNQIDSAFETIRHGRGETYHKLDSSAMTYSDMMACVCFEQRLFLTKEGLLGLGPQGLREGDDVKVVVGCDMPIVTRENGREKVQEGYVGMKEALVDEGDADWEGRESMEALKDGMKGRGKGKGRQFTENLDREDRETQTNIMGFKRNAESKSCEFIGPAYVHGVMHGEAMARLGEHGLEFEALLLV